MLEELNEEINRIGSQINLNKTKMMPKTDPQIAIKGCDIENVGNYI